MNVVAWLMFGNLVILAMTLWSQVEAKSALDVLDDMNSRQYGRMQNLIEDLMVLNGKNKHDRS
jgi:hypothetical protein